MSTATIGRPKKWQSVEELETGIHAYFEACDIEKRPYTMAGLARALDCSRQTLINYEHADAAFMDTVKRARARVEQWVEESLWSKVHPAGPIFSLKNNFGWRDEQQVTVTHEAVFTLRSQADLELFEPPALSEGRMLSVGESDSTPIEADLVRVESADRGET